jgi:hypothetical protein
MGACPRFALTYGEKVEEAKAEKTLDLPAERRGIL